MKNSLLSFLIIFFSITSSAQADYAFYPRYKEVVNYYFNTYSSSNKPEDYLIKFEKRPDGWHVCVRAYTANFPILKDGLLWSLKTKSFTEIPFTKKTETEPVNTEYASFYDNWEGVHFNASPYFGYMGSDWDVIQAYGNAQNLPDTILYGVGRAYSSYASNLIHDNSGLSDTLHRFKLKDGLNALSAEQLEKYRFYRHKAIEFFKKVNDKNPDFETLVGGIGLKLAHEYVTAFSDLRQFQNNEEALKELPDAIYSEFYISLAKNYLNSCSKNAILFVNGDTDTFTLLYVQAKLNFRTDVTVINTSLLLTQRYINHLRYPYLGTDGLQYAFSDKAIANPNGEVVYVQRDKEKTWTLNKMIAYLDDPKNTTALDQVDLFIVNGTQLKTEVNSKTITWPITSASYMLRDNLMMFDIISNYGNKRPIYFAQTLDGEKFFGLNNYLRLEGLAFRLVNKSAEPILSDGAIEPEVLYKNLLSTFTYKGMEQSLISDNKLRNNYAVIFGWLVYAYINDKQNTKAKEVMEAYFKNFPDAYVPYDSSVIYLMKCYYTLGEIDKANEIGKRILLNMQQKRINIASLFDKETESDLNAKIIREMTEVAETFHQKEFYNPLLK